MGLNLDTPEARPGNDALLRRSLLVLLSSLAISACSACGGGGESDRDHTATPGSPAPATATTVTARATPSPVDLQRLSTTEVPGFTRSDSRVVASAASSTYTAAAKTSGGASLVATVRISGCDPFICATLDPKDYESAEAQRNLRSVLSTALAESPGLIWEFGAVELAPGKDGLHTYAVGYFEQTSASGTSRVSTNAYRAWYHDGSLYVFIEVAARGASTPRSLDETKALMSAAEAEKAATEIFAAFAGEFGG